MSISPACGCQVKKKKTKKKKLQYECELCGENVSHLLCFCACDKCEDMLRKHIRYYRKKREEIERDVAAFKRWERKQKNKPKGLLR